MEIRDLKGRLPNEIIESLEARGISALTPPQEQAVGKGLLEGKNIVVASPTASGKTVVAEIACVNAILSKGKKAIYIAPMRALATEKHAEFREAYPYISSAISIGDLDSNDLWLKEYKMLFFSTEKFDSLLRHGIDWLQNIGCIIFDEVHMLGDLSRGPTLELLITKLSIMCDAQMIALSATIGNAGEIAQWMGSGLVVSDYRPVRLLKGVLHDGRIFQSGDRKDSIELLGGSEIPETRILQDTLERGKQLLAFYSTKRNAETGAARLSKEVKARLSREEAIELNEIGAKVLNALDRPTEQCIKLSDLVSSGIAFHHSGLVNKQRSIIEDAFRANRIKAICSTTTLGYGVNLPAHTVLVKELTRFGDGHSERLGINELTQLFGRAGRPRYDSEGRALVIASTKPRISELLGYISKNPEPVDSSLAVAPVLRTHILAFIAENFLNSENAIQKFMSKSFYSFQYGNQRHINSIIEGILGELQEWGFIEGQGKSYSATRLGKRISELYIDPLSAKWIVDSLNHDLDNMGMLYMICNTLEMRPHIKATKEAEEAYAAYSFLSNTSEASGGYYRMSDYYPEKAFSTALMLNDWMEEMKEPQIVAKYASTPGALYSKLSNADWLIYAAAEIARIIRKPQHGLIETRVRMRYGIRRELLDLVRLEQVGRARARALYINGIRKVSDIRENKDKVRSILGNEIAERILAQVE